MNALNEYATLRRVLLGRPQDIFGNEERIAAEWQELNFAAPPCLAHAVEQFAAFESRLIEAGVQVDYLEPDPALSLDAIYVRDASVVTPRGMLLCRMGKTNREHEPAVQARTFEALGLPVIGTVQPPGCLEGGDVVWFDERTVAVGRGYRTNAEGIRQLRALVGDEVDVVDVALPHYRGPGDVFHLMSIVSPVASDLAVVYSPLMVVPFREWLCERGIRLVEVPHEEFDSMGANVLAIAPRRCVMLDGNPITRRRLEAAGVEVITYAGSEISLKGGGGPTCLTRPLIREI